MASWITIKHLLLCQDAKSLHRRNREGDVLGHLTGKIDILWAQQCITTAVKMSTSRLRLVNASWIHSSFPLAIIKCHSFLPHTDCSCSPRTCKLHYKILIRRYPSLTSGMTPLSAHSTGGNFQTQISKSSHSHTSSSSCQGHSTHMPCRVIQSNLSFSYAPAAPNEITYNNSRSRHNQRIMTSEGGHPNDESAFTSEGATTLTTSCSPKLIPRRLLRYGHCPHGHRPGKLPSVPGTSRQCSL
jgi:hypothetical protein